METHRRRQLTIFAAVITLAFLFLSSVVSTSRHLSKCKCVGEGEGVGLVVRKMMVGPGSWPPSCRSKCGRCRPCRAVHVPIHPGFSAPLEYYPEAWRCKCRDKLFMP